MRPVAWVLILVAAAVGVWMALRPSGSAGPDSALAASRASESAPAAAIRGVESAPAIASSSRSTPPESGSPDDITGRVIERDGRPVTPVEVRVVLQVPKDQPNYVAVADFDRRVAVDLEGRFRLAVPRHGKYLVIAEPEGLAITLRNWVNPGDFVELIADLPATVRGCVKRVDNGQTVSGAHLAVYVDGLSDWPVRETSTSAKGEYDFGGLPATGVALRTRANGLVQKWDDLALRVGAATEHDISLERGLAVSGRVLDRAGSPIAGVRVEGASWPDGPWQIAETDAEGRFALAGFKSGDLGFWARKEGFVRGWFTADLKPESDFEPLVFTLIESELVEGSVTDPEGRPLPGAHVDTKAAEVATDAAGRFKVAAEPGPETTLRVTCAGYSPRTLLRNHPTFTDSKTIVLEHADVTIVGHVRDPEGRALAGVRVRCHATVDGGERFVRVTASGQDGGFEIANCPRGSSFEVVALAPDFSEAFAQVAQQEGPARVAIDLTLGAKPSIEGTVVDAEGKPIEGARLVLSVNGPMHLMGAAPTLTDRDGRFTLRSPFSLDAALWLEVSAHGFWRSWVALERNQVGRLEPIVLDRAGRIRGRLVDAETNAPIPNVRVSLRGGGGAYEPRMPPEEEPVGRTGGTGDFDFEAPPRPYWLTPEAPGYTVEPKAIDLQPGASVDLGTIALRVGASLQGTIVTNGGAGGSFALYLRAPGHPAIRVAHTDEAGKFRADGIPPDRYEAFAVVVNQDWLRSTGSEFSPAWPLGPVQVTLGEKNSLEGRLPESATLSLRLTGDLAPAGTLSQWEATCSLADQKPQVTITALDGTPVSACAGALTSTAWIANPDVTEGTISLGLPRGRYRISFAYDGFKPTETVVQLDAGKATAAELALKRSGAEPRPR